MADSLSTATCHWIFSYSQCKNRFSRCFTAMPSPAAHRMQNDGAGGAGSRKTLRPALHSGGRTSAARKCAGKPPWGARLTNARWRSSTTLPTAGELLARTATSGLHLAGRNEGPSPQYLSHADEPARKSRSRRASPAHRPHARGAKVSEVIGSRLSTRHSHAPM